MFYTIYKITNKINGKEYIGKHQTKDLEDDYMGSGKNLKHAINKYGIDNFVKEILFVFETEIEMNQKEAEIVTEEYCNKKNTYNLCPGGKGGWGYVNSNGLSTGVKIINQKGLNNKNQNCFRGGQKIRELLNDPVYYEQWSKKLKESLVGKERHIEQLNTPEAIEKKKKTWKENNTHVGKNNNMYNKCWIKNPLSKECGVIKKEDLPKWTSKGWQKGRYQIDAVYIKIS